MEDRDQIQVLAAAHSIGNDVRSIGDNEFPRTWHTPWSTKQWLRGKQLNTLENPRRDGCSALGTVFFDIVANRNEMPDGSPAPNDFHRGALPSEDFPHDLSHFATFS